MIEKNKLEQIKKLISDGFNLELISFELDIPMQVLQSLANEQKSQPTLKTARQVISERNMTFHSKTQQLRQRYKQLYYTSAKKIIEQPKFLSEEESELISSTISLIESTVLEMEGLSKSERRQKAFLICNEFKKIEAYPLTFEQSNKLYGLINVKNLYHLASATSNAVDIVVSKTKHKITRKLVESIDIEIDSTEDIDELKKLNAKITSQMVGMNQIQLESISSRLSRKISNLQQQIAIHRLKYDVSANIQQIIYELSSGTIDVHEAQNIIRAEATQRLERSPQSRFSLTQEQHQNQILLQIKTVLMENSEKYPLINPEDTLFNLQALCGGDLESSLASVIGNLIGSKNFDEARNLCNKLSSLHYTDGQISKSIYRQQIRIRNSEISDFVLRGLHSIRTIEEDASYFKLIDDGLKQGNISPSAISLGKSQDGSINITLADIWSDKVNQNIPSKC